MQRIILILFFVSISIVCHGQLSLVKRAQKAQLKRDLDKSESLLAKCYEKNPELSGLYFAWAQLKFDSAYSNFNIDSAYKDILYSRKNFSALEEKEMLKHQKLDINLLTIDQLKKDIEQAAFFRAIKENDEAAFIYFLKAFPNTKHENSAIKKRDSLAYIEVVSVNTYEAYQEFMDKYPEALQFQEAKARYEKLYFDKSTADGKLISYQKFLRIHPSTPYRKDAEKQIFEISTASGKPSVFKQFLANYPKSFWTRKANRLLYHLIDNSSVEQTDSTSMTINLEEIGPLIAIRKNQLYGFMDQQGKEVIAPRHQLLDLELLCTVLTEDYYLADRKIFSRNQKVIFDAYYKKVEHLGSGVLKIEVHKGVRIWHKSGWPISDEVVEDAKLLNKAFIAFKQNEKWGLMTLSGRVLLLPVYDNIIHEGFFYLLKSGDQYDVANHQMLSSLADKNRINFQPLYIDYQLLDPNHIWLQTEYGETVFDKSLNEIIPYNQQEIISIADGHMIISENKLIMMNNSFERKLTIDGNIMDRNEDYAVAKSKGNELLLSLKTFDIISETDSIELIGLHFAQVYRNDSSWLFFMNNKSMEMEPGVIVNVLAEAGAAQYISVYDTERGNTSYYDRKGEFVFKEDFKNIVPVGNEYLVVSENDNKGLYNQKGERLLSSKYDAIANYHQGYISLLLDQKFGILNEQLKVFIEAEYDQKITRYSDSIFIAKKNEGFGLINNLGDELSSFDFDEIIYWNDTAAIVNEDYKYYFYDFKNNTQWGSGFKSLRVVQNHEEKVIKILGDEGYGIFSNKNGEIIPPTFNDIVNFDAGKAPIYFTEKHVEEAEYYVVVYFNSSGEVINKNAYTEEEYLLIYCEQ